MIIMVLATFLKRYSPQFAKPFLTPIEYSFDGKKDQVENFAAAVYVAFRCGILHEAHVALYGVVHDDAHAIEYCEKGITLYENGNDCPTVVISPKKFFYEMKIAFEDYFQKLGDPDAKWHLLRNNFKKKSW